MARSLRRRLGRGAGATLRKARVALRRSRTAHRLQRRALPAAWKALSPSALVADRPTQAVTRHLQRADHLPRGPRGASARHAAWRIPRGDRELLGSKRRECRARRAPAALRDNREIACAISLP